MQFKTALIVGVFTCFWCSPAFAIVKVQLKFPAGFDKQTIVDKIKADYNFLGADIQFVDAGADVVVDFVDSFANPKGDRWGDATKGKKEASVYIKEFTEDPAVTGKTTPAERLQMLANTGSHELAHLLCANHNWNAPATMKAKDDTGKEKNGNGKPVDLMTNGGKNSIATRKTDLSFNEDSKKEIQKGVQMIMSGKSWNHKSMDEKSIWLISGRSETMSFENENDPNDVLMRDNNRIDIMANMFDLGTNLSLDFDMGFVSDELEFVPLITDDLLLGDPSGQGLQGIFTLDPMDMPTFAIGGEIGTAFEGLFFEPLSLAFSDPISGSFAEEPGLTNYYRTVDISFDVNNDKNPDIFMKLNTSNLASTDGFHQKTPEPTSTINFLLLATLGAASTLKRKLKPSQLTEKEPTKVG